jgi:2-succinyl-5-enolpyruvyl-6-hydroxy-3-cyclohexene-1-carboxylate synthase
VHLTRALREPLMPDEEPGELTGPWAGRADGAPWTAVRPTTQSSSATTVWRQRTLVVAGDGSPFWGRIAGENAGWNGWPVIAEPSSGAWTEKSLRAGALLLGSADWLARNRPDRVVVVGRPTLSRPVSALLADAEVDVETVAVAPRWPDAGRSTARVGFGFPDGPGEGGTIEPGWAAEWRSAAARVGAAVDAVLDGAPGLSAARLARDVVAALPFGSLLVLGSSTPVRDVDRLAVPRGDLTVLANRGVAGIDGTISTAVGAALDHARTGMGPAFALMGDLTFLHDLTGLLLGERETAPDLTVVVPDNDGGGIFAQLEPGADRFVTDYRRVFGTPHGRDLVAIAQALGWAATEVSAPGELRAALAQGGPRVVVVRTDQRAEAGIARELRRAAERALA